MSDGATTPPGVAVDNDIIIKASCYGLTREFWPTAALEIGVLGAAPFVVRDRINRMRLASCPDSALQAAHALFSTAVTLEPTDDELELASEIETAAQRAAASLDAGESQLAAMVVTRAIALLETGDKRAIRGFEAIINAVPALQTLGGRVRCLEQLVLLRLGDEAHSQLLAAAVCGEPDVDRTLSICFRCYSPPPTGHVVDVAGLESYINALRSDAPQILAP